MVAVLSLARKETNGRVTLNLKLTADRRVRDAVHHTDAHGRSGSTRSFCDCFPGRPEGLAMTAPTCKEFDNHDSAGVHFFEEHRAVAHVHDVWCIVVETAAHAPSLALD